MKWEKFIMKMINICSGIYNINGNKKDIYREVIILPLLSTRKQNSN